MIDLIHIGVGRGAPCRRPHGELSVGKLGKRSRVGGYFDVETDFVEHFLRVIQNAVRRVIGGVARNGKGERKLFTCGVGENAVLQGISGFLREFKRSLTRFVVFVIRFVDVGIIVFQRFGHRAINEFRQSAAAVIVQTQAGIHRVHDRAADRQFVYVSGVDADIAVAERIGDEIIERFLIHAFQFRNHFVGGGRHCEVHFPALHRVV